MATISPSDAVDEIEWKVSDTKVASISKDGELTVLKEGKVTVYAVSKLNKDIQGSFEIEIKAKEETPVTPTEPVEPTEPVTPTEPVSPGATEEPKAKSGCKNILSIFSILTAFGFAIFLRKKH